MHALMDLLWYHGKLLGITWSAWKVIGWLGNLAFSSRFLVQWYATEKSRQVVVPPLFWWLSLIGSVTLLAYWIHKGDSVGIFAYAFAWIPYLRSLMIHRQNKAARIACAGCGQKNPPQSNYCPNCGGKLN